LGIENYSEDIMNFNETVKAKIENFTSEKIDSIGKIGSGANNAVYLVKTKNKKYALKIRERGLYDFFDNESKALEILGGYIAPQLYYHDFSITPVNGV
jgi:predicted Ser/Thr protein kinase